MSAPAPRSTYRLQLTPAFGFDAAAAIAPYLAELGVSHVYVSPCLQAAPGSTHGYDVVDHGRVNAELGGADAHRRMCDAFRAAGLGQVLDIVPNHMAIGVRENRWWWDVLENGPSSVYAAYFDVNWDPPEQKLRNTVLMPILSDHYGRVLEAGLIHVAREGGGFTVNYEHHQLPVAPRSLDTLVAAAAEACGRDELESIAAALGRLPHSSSTDRESVRERHRDKEVLRTRLQQLCEEDPAVATAIDDVIARTNIDWDGLDALLERQNYRLAYWRTAQREVDYRRFFDINTLIGLRTEDPQVFADTHELVMQWVNDGLVDGLRVDHPDGLRDPKAYFDRLQQASGGIWVVVEKILERGEDLPESWPVAGTSGYDFMALVDGLFIDATGEAALTDLYRVLVGEVDYDELVRDKKHLVMRDVLAADLIRLTALFADVCERNRRYRDYSRNELHEVLREVIASFPVYRTYVQAETSAVAPPDVAVIQAAVADAAARRPDLDHDLFGFLEDLLLLRVRGTAPPGLPGGLPAVSSEAELVMRFQQTTGPVMAKGVEDTAFYTYNRFVALNEVGGDPSSFGRRPEVLDAWLAAVATSRPTTMLASSTHDTKRSEDVRHRLAILSELPDEWSAFTQRWITDGPVGANDQYLLLQTIVGAWPLTIDRAAAYMEKATKEAKDRTSWIDADPGYDKAVLALVEHLLADRAFIDDLDRLLDLVVAPGRVNSLAATLIKLTAPGVPDTYQGTELWDLSLVDPDNRRPVDYDCRQRLLADLRAGLTVEEVTARSDAGLPKLWVITQALRAGASGPYRSLAARGPNAAHVFAYTRGDRHVTVVPRLTVTLERQGGWRGTGLPLPGGRWHNLLTGDEVGGTAEMAELLDRFPVALLESRPG